VNEKGLSIREVWRLTEYQAMILAGAFCPEDGRVKLTPEQQAQWKAWKKKRKGA